MIVAGAIDVTAKVDAKFGNAEIKTVDVTGDLKAVARKEIDAVALGTKGKAIGIVGVGIKVSFSERAVSARGNNCAWAEGKFHRLIKIIREEPAPDVHVAGRRIVKID